MVRGKEPNHFSFPAVNKIIIDNHNYTEEFIGYEHLSDKNITIFKLIRSEKIKNLMSIDQSVLVAGIMGKYAFKCDVFRTSRALGELFVHTSKLELVNNSRKNCFWYAKLNYCNLDFGRGNLYVETNLSSSCSHAFIKGRYDYYVVRNFSPDAFQSNQFYLLIDSETINRSIVNEDLLAISLALGQWIGFDNLIAYDYNHRVSSVLTWGRKAIKVPKAHQRAISSYSEIDPWEISFAEKLIKRIYLEKNMSGFLVALEKYIYTLTDDYLETRYFYIMSAFYALSYNVKMNTEKIKENTELVSSSLAYFLIEKIPVEIGQGSVIRFLRLRRLFESFKLEFPSFLNDEMIFYENEFNTGYLKRSFTHGDNIDCYSRIIRLRDLFLKLLSKIINYNGYIFYESEPRKPTDSELKEFKGISRSVKIELDRHELITWPAYAVPKLIKNEMVTELKSFTDKLPGKTNGKVRAYLKIMPNSDDIYNSFSFNISLIKFPKEAITIFYGEIANDGNLVLRGLGKKDITIENMDKMYAVLSGLAKDESINAAIKRLLIVEQNLSIQEF